MHIVHVITRLLRAGAEENTVETCRWQASDGHRVTLIHGDAWDRHWRDHLPEGVERIALPDMVHPLAPVQDARAVSALRHCFRTLQPDVIHTHQSKAGILGRHAATILPDAVVAHGIHIVPFAGVGPAKRALYIAAEKMVGRRTDVFICVSEAVGQAYLDAGITRRGRMFCIRSGMDLARFRTASLPSDWRMLLEVPSDSPRPPVALMMAAFEPRKRHVQFLQSFVSIARDMPDLKLLLAGRGPEEQNVRSAVAELGLTGRVIFAGHRPDPEALFALADISVLTSEREGLPRVAVQSVAAGCPMVAQDLPGLDEIITHGRNGWIADSGDMGTVTRAVVSLLSDPAQLDRLRTGARDTDVSAWDLDTFGARTTALYGLPIRKATSGSARLEAA